jgi:hypothetical protein
MELLPTPTEASPIHTLSGQWPSCSTWMLRQNPQVARHYSRPSRVGAFREHGKGFTVEDKWPGVWELSLGIYTRAVRKVALGWMHRRTKAAAPS